MSARDRVGHLNPDLLGAYLGFRRQWLLDVADELVKEGDTLGNLAPVVWLAKPLPNLHLASLQHKHLQVLVGLTLA